MDSPATPNKDSPATPNMDSPANSYAKNWSGIALDQIEDLQDAVLGAGLEAVQFSRGHLSGSLIFSQQNNVTFSSGQIGGKVALTGSLSDTLLTIGLGLNISAGTRHWLQEVVTGSIGVFLPGDDHQALYTPGSFYVTAALSMEQLEAEAAARELLLDRKQLNGTGFHPYTLPPTLLEPAHRSLAAIHADTSSSSAGSAGGHGFSGEALLTLMINHYARPPQRGAMARSSKARKVQIVTRAKEYIHSHLGDPISLDAIAAAALTSRRTLCRVFQEMLGESPHNYVHTLRLHRIRRDLAAPAELMTSVSLIANRWGISELGRFSGSYRAIFDELPSTTRAETCAPTRQRPTPAILARSA